MKTVLLGLVFFSQFFVAVMRAQQRADWRPSIADDNKTATWDDTAEWFNGELRDVFTSFETKTTANDTDFSISIVRINGRCKLNVAVASWDGSIGKYGTGVWDSLSDLDIYKEKRGSLDLSLLDPLSIMVKEAPDGRYVLGMEAKDRAEFFRYHRWSRQVNLLNVKGAAPIHNLVDWPNACVPDKKNRTRCDETDGLDSDLSLTFKDISLAQRAARAFMHTALLCGGAKAVSPF
jgi:hypothetical protein